MSVEYKLIVNDNSDDIDTMVESFSTIEGPCMNCVDPLGDNTLIATKTRYLSRSTMKIWLRCIVCNEESTLKCKITQ